MEPESGIRKTVNLKFIDDNDVGKMTLCLTKLLRSKKASGDGNAGDGRTRQNAALKDKEVEDDGHEEVLKLMSEELPDDCMEYTTNKLSEELLDEKEESQFGFQTPKKSGAMTLKAQESARKYYGTPNKLETPSKLRSGKTNDMVTPTKTPINKSQLKKTSTRSSRISFGGEMGATPSKGDVLTCTPTKSALKKTRRSIMESPKTPSSKRSKVNGESIPTRALRRIASNENLRSGTPSRRQSMAAMATIEEATGTVPKTPHSDRRQMRECITTAIQSVLHNNSESDASDSSDDEDDYEPEGEESSEEKSGSDDKENSETDEEESRSPVRKSALTRVTKKDQTPVTPSRSRRREEVNYDFSTDAYFETFAAKDITSNNTLSRLRNPRLREDALRDLLKDADVGHKEPLAKLTADHHTLFSRWLFTLREGFNILLYGLGSKRHLLQSLHDEMLCDSQVLVVNGFFPGLTIKEILDTILTSLLGMKDAPANPLEAVDIIENIQSSRHADTLYLLVHNLDGPSLKNNKAQTVLSKLAKIQNVRLIASIDHINAPLMWDQTKLYRFNFSWWDVTTFLPYSVETSFESSLLIKRSGALQLSSLHSVFKSLTPNAKKIYLMIAKHQLQNDGNQSYSGYPFQQLYWNARTEFVVSSEKALRVLLTEFLDHQMVKVKRGGEEALVIPIENTLVQQFVQAQEEKED